MNRCHSRLSKLLEGLHAWIVKGPCQSASGAFYSPVNAQETSATAAVLAPEVTGSALTYLSASLYCCDTNTQQIRRRSERAADWLLARIQAGHLTTRGDGSDVYTFDLAVMATGLLFIGRRLLRSDYIQAALLLLQRLGQALGEDEHLSTLRPAPLESQRPAAWSVQGKAHLLKCVQPFLLASHLGFQASEEDATLIVNALAQLQQDDGRFITHPNDVQTCLHHHLSACEGLWIYGSCYQHPERLAKARRGVEWAWQQQMKPGGFPHRPERGRSSVSLSEQSVATVRTLRLGLLLGVCSPHLVMDSLQDIVVVSERCKAVICGPATPQMDQNTWATLVAAQALHVACGGQLPWQVLV